MDTSLFAGSKRSSDLDAASLEPDPASTYHHLVRHPVLFPAIMAVVAALIGAIGGGLVTAYATKETVRAQIDSAQLQADATRIGQERDARGRTYEAFLNAVADARALHEETVDCAPLHLDSYLVRNDYETVYPERSGPARMNMSVARKHMSPEDFATCTQAARSYRQARLMLDKAHNALHPWGTKDTVTSAARLVSLFPKVTCRTLPAGQGGRQCEYEIAVSAWMVNQAPQRRAGYVLITDDNLEDNVIRRDVLAAGRTLAWLGSGADRTYEQALARFQMAACADLIDATRRTC